MSPRPLLMRMAQLPLARLAGHGRCRWQARHPMLLRRPMLPLAASGTTTAATAHRTLVLLEKGAKHGRVSLRRLALVPMLRSGHTMWPPVLHGGNRRSSTCHLAPCLLILAGQLCKVFQKTDALLLGAGELGRQAMTCGTTSTVVYFHASDVFTACAGDSRAVKGMRRNGTIVAEDLSKDHKPVGARSPGADPPTPFPRPHARARRPRCEHPVTAVRECGLS